MASILPDITENDVKALTERIRNAVKATGRKGVVIGLSGGIDSAVVAKLCVNALGSKNVMCVFMPSDATPSEDRKTTKELCAGWNAEYVIRDIQPAIDALTAAPDMNTPLSVGNMTARCRMAVLYNIANENKRLVAGTTNRSEYMIGYFTKFGDGACDISPLSGHYKTQVRQIAKMLNIPDKIIKKTPSANLWEGQTDEGEIGISYDILDPILYMAEKGRTDKEISDAAGASEEMIISVRRMISVSDHKRRMPIQP